MQQATHVPEIRRKATCNSLSFRSHLRAANQMGEEGIKCDPGGHGYIPNSINIHGRRIRLVLIGGVILGH